MDHVLSFALASWLAAVLGSLAGNLRELQQGMDELARRAGQTLVEQIQDVRLWNASHGGVYVPVTSETPPNPALGSPRRDVTTTDGVRLTLVNPAYMTRQLARLAAARGSASFHLTSLDPLAAGNAPDAWEASALRAFEAGVPEVLERLGRDGAKDEYRYMAPLYVEPACAECHGAQGYEVGDVRGGLSVTMRGDAFDAGEATARRATVGLHLAIAVLGAVLMVLLAQHRQRTLAMMEANARLLEDQNRILAHAAATDPLTELWNRRALMRRLEESLNVGRRERRPLAIIIGDIDHFKKINDTFGHATGDAVIQAVARNLEAICRPGDVVGRFGGEEFLLAAPDCGRSGGLAVAERARVAVAGLEVAVEPGVAVEVTMSFGVAVLTPGSASIDEVLRRADAALYAAKAGGRNMVCFWEPPPGTGRDERASSQEKHALCSGLGQECALAGEACGLCPASAETLDGRPDHRRVAEA